MGSGKDKGNEVEGEKRVEGKWYHGRWRVKRGDLTMDKEGGEGFRQRCGEVGA